MATQLATQTEQKGPQVSQRMSRKEVERIVRKYARNEEEVKLMMAIIKHESGFDPRATRLNRNGTYDYGLAQINSSNFKALGVKSPEELYDPENNVRKAFVVLRGSRRIFEQALGKNNVSLILGLKFYGSFGAPSTWKQVEKFLKSSGLKYTQEELDEAKRLWTIYKERYEPKRQFSLFVQHLKEGRIETMVKRDREEKQVKVGVIEEVVAQADTVVRDVALQTKRAERKEVQKVGNEWKKLEVLTNIANRLPHGVIMDLGNGIWISKQGMVVKEGEKTIRLSFSEVNGVKDKEREILKSKLKDLSSDLLNVLEEHTKAVKEAGKEDVEVVVRSEGRAKPSVVKPFVNADRLPIPNGNVKEYAEKLVEELNRKNGKKVKVEVAEGKGISYSYESGKIVVGKDTPKDTLIAGLFQAYAMALTEGYAYAYGKDSSITRDLVDRVARELVEKVHGENGLHVYEKGLKEYAIDMAYELEETKTTWGYKLKR